MGLGTILVVIGEIIALLEDEDVYVIGCTL